MTKNETAFNTTLESIGKKLIELRIDKGYTSHASFALDHDLPRIQYWRMEKGCANITLRSLHKISAIHGLTIEELFAEMLQDQLKEKKRSSLLKSKR